MNKLRRNEASTKLTVIDKAPIYPPRGKSDENIVAARESVCENPKTSIRRSNHHASVLKERPASVSIQLSDETMIKSYKPSATSLIEC